jgi:hypothetical protein
MGQQLGGASDTYGQMAAMRPTDVQAGSLANTSLTPYMNPFQQSVIDTTMGELNRQETLQGNAMQDQAQRAGAFGGDRMAVQQAENNRNFDMTRASTLANLNSANFNNAQQMGTNDLNRNMQAQQSNQGVNANMMQAGASGLAGLGQSGASGLGSLGQFGVSGLSNLAGQGASGLGSVGQFGVSGLGSMGQSGTSGLAGVGQGMAGMGQNQMQFGQGQMGNLASQGFNMGQQINSNQMQVGNQQQGQLQDILNNIMGQTNSWQNYGDTGLQRYFGATQSPNGYGTSTTNGTVTGSSNPGLGGILGSVGSIVGAFM